MSGYPAAPGSLSVAARKWWARILRECEGLEDSQLLILQGMLEAFDRMKEAQRKMKKEGITYKDRFGQIKVHPLATVERDCRSAIVHAYKVLGLDLDYGVDE